MFVLQKSAPRQMPTPQGYSSSSPYAGSGAPSSMYMGVTPYAASPFNGTSMPPYDGSAYRYNYNSRLPGGNPYRPLQLSATPAYSGGPMIGTGMCFLVDFGHFIVLLVLFRSYGVLILILFNNLIRFLWVNPDAK